MTNQKRETLLEKKSASNGTTSAQRVNVSFGSCIIDNVDHVKFRLNCLTHFQYVSVNKVLFRITASSNILSLARDLLSLLSNKNNRVVLSAAASSEYRLRATVRYSLNLENKLKYKPLLIKDTFNS